MIEYDCACVLYCCTVRRRVRRLDVILTCVSTSTGYKQFGVRPRPSDTDWEDDAECMLELNRMEIKGMRSVMRSDPGRPYCPVAVHCALIDPTPKNEDDEDFDELGLFDYVPDPVYSCDLEKKRCVYYSWRWDKNQNKFVNDDGTDAVERDGNWMSP
ncbi:hypothetical protein [Cyprinid herpesvirus 3]|uniref:Uncharacterized protein n=1 Tax=Cyprinid herpesvirus 3 TaxID=180230 RepID=A4FTB4_CYHV3|nr:hypothetical protein [Cyprinid herpesvirus 3]BAF48988.1 hypothetical protein [Cyprinid herpesvirus 3]